VSRLAGCCSKSRRAIGWAWRWPPRSSASKPAGSCTAITSGTIESPRRLSTPSTDYAESGQSIVHQEIEGDMINLRMPLGRVSLAV